MDKLPESRLGASGQAAAEPGAESSRRKSNPALSLKDVIEMPVPGWNFDLDTIVGPRDRRSARPIDFDFAEERD